MDVDKFYTSYKLNDYITPGLKLWSNRLGLRFDTWNSCTNMCSYCYADVMLKGSQERLGLKYNKRIARFGDMKKIHKRITDVLEKGILEEFSYVDYALASRFFWEVGTMGEPFQEADRNFGATYNLLKLSEIYQIPMYFNTKANLLCHDERYFDALCDANESAGSIIDLSLISQNDKLKEIEPNAPLASERIALLERLSENNVPTIASCRPMVKGYTDDDFEGYIRTMCEAGVKAIHMRDLFLRGKQISKGTKWRKHADENGMVFKKFAYQYGNEYFMRMYEIANRITKEEYPDTVITGSHRLFFLLNKTSNKADYSKMPRKVQRGLFPYHMVDMLKRVDADSKGEPILCTFDKYMRPELGKLGGDTLITVTNENCTLVWTNSCMAKPRSHKSFTIENLFIDGLWDGFGREESYKSKGLNWSYLNTVVGMRSLIDNRKDKNPVLIGGHRAYVYVPPIPEELNDDIERFITVDEAKELGVY